MEKTKFQSKQTLFFRKFSRKKYAIFNSLGKQIKISALGVACTLIVSPVQSQSKSESDSISPKVDLEEVEVIGQKSTVLASEMPRMIEMIPAQVIKNSPSQSFQDFLEFNSNIDMRQRGPHGAQADVSIRGSSFDQVLILLNGVNLSDPQTGHYSLNLPIDRENLSKIEVLNGPSARALGANAYSGAINLVTSPIDSNVLNVSLSVGEFGYFYSHLGINQVLKNSQHLISLNNTSSDGYMKNTDFRSLNFFYQGNFNISAQNSAYLTMGFSKKEFGANSYYSPKYPDQYDKNGSSFVIAGLKLGGVVSVNPRIYWRRHTDIFELFREGDGWYKYDSGFAITNNPLNTAYDTVRWYTNHNYHISDVFGANTDITFRSVAGKTTLGFALRSDNILSTNLGNELAIPIAVKGTDLMYTKQATRSNADIYLEHMYTTDKLFLSAGTMISWNTYEPDKIHFFPGIDLGYEIINHVSIIGSYNYALGVPSFTDLSYQDASNKGNNQLKPYSHHSFEGGFKSNFNQVSFRTVGFYTKGIDNIEWIMNDTLFKFSPINVPLSENYGLEVSLNYTSDNPKQLLIPTHIYIGYTNIKTYRNVPEAISKYSSLRNKFVVSIQQNLTENLTLSWNLMIKNRDGKYTGYDFEKLHYVANAYPKAILVDARLSYTYKWALFYVEATNLLDKTYYESGSIPQPGRWITGGINLKLGY